MQLNQVTDSGDTNATATSHPGKIPGHACNAAFRCDQQRTDKGCFRQTTAA